MPGEATKSLLTEKDYELLLKEVELEVHKLFETHHTDKYVFHTIEETEHVAKAAEEIANHYQLDDGEFFIVMTAAWFLEIGFLIDPEDPREASAEQAKAFLKARNVPKGIIKAVKKCILAAEIPQDPENLLERIVCDASLYHWGTDDFKKDSRLLYEEIVHVGEEEIPESEWIAFIIEELRRHRFQTDYCRLLLQDRKENILKYLLKKGKDLGMTKKEIKKARKKSDKQGMKEAEEEDAKENNKEKKQVKGIDTMLKIASNSNQRLSKLADYKARNMITVNSIILSVVMGLMFKELKGYTNLAIPAYFLMLVCVVTLTFAILATRPGQNKGHFNPKDVRKRKVDLLFFGDFYKMDMDTYKDTMWDVMKDHELLYDIIIKDIYSQGVDLGKKFKLLRLAYNFFMFGLIISVVGFIVASFI